MVCSWVLPIILRYNPLILSVSIKIFNGSGNRENIAGGRMKFCQKRKGVMGGKGFSSRLFFVKIKREFPAEEKNGNESKKISAVQPANRDL